MLRKSAIMADSRPPTNQVSIDTRGTRCTGGAFRRNRSFDRRSIGRRVHYRARPVSRRTDNSRHNRCVLARNRRPRRNPSSGDNPSSSAPPASAKNLPKLPRQLFVAARFGKPSGGAQKDQAHGFASDWVFDGLRFPDEHVNAPLQPIY